MGRLKVLLRLVRFSAFSLATGFMISAVGCSLQADGPSRIDLTGNVTYQGKPVPAGEIRFDPDASKKNEGPGGVADIKNGTYTMRPGMGIIGGPHIVRIFGYDGQTPAGPEKEMAPLGKAIFPPYQVAVDLPDEPGTFDFEVEVETP